MTLTKAIERNREREAAVKRLVKRDRQYNLLLAYCAWMIDAIDHGKTEEQAEMIREIRQHLEERHK